MEKEGDLIILVGGFNDYILSHRSCQYFSKLLLRELITYKHGPEGPGTTVSNKKNNNIDGIWGSPGLVTTFCSYLTVNYGLKSDHRLIWVKISLVNALVDNTLPSKIPSARKIPLHHPSSHHKYISKLRRIYRQHNLLNRLRALDNHQKCTLSPRAIKEYEEIYKLLPKSRSKFNSRVQRLQMSNV